MSNAIPDGETFIASRWTQGNLLFPTRIVVNSLHVSKVKPRLFGNNEESIAVAPGCFGTDFDWGVVVEHPHRLGGRDEPDHQPRASQGRRAAHS